MTAAASSTAISATISNVRRSWRSCARRGRSLASRIGERSRPTGITTGSASEARNSKSSIRWGRRPRRLAKRMRRSSSCTAMATRPAETPIIYNFSRNACTQRTPARWWAIISELCGSWTNSTMDHPRTRSFTRSQAVIPRTYGGTKRLKDNLGRRKAVMYSPDNVWTTQYRPFVKQHCYIDYVLVHNASTGWTAFSRLSDSENRVICVPGIGSTKPFSALVADTMPDIQLMFNGQYFPRYRYRERAEVQRELPGIESGRERLDNISDTALRAFRVRYNDNTITKDAIFDYVYGVLHASYLPGTLRQRSGEGTAAHSARARFPCLRQSRT